MGSLSPKILVPYLNNKDCSLGFCSFYCPQWCYIIYSPPPPFHFHVDNERSSSPNFSPLVVAIIGILASVFLLFSYYTIISKYCGINNTGLRSRSARRNHNNDYESDINENRNPTLHEVRSVATVGLDETLIKAITTCKYKKSDGFVEGTDCAVCLSEFEEDESLRLLPKCSHAFHIQCIDTWLRSHSNCPLCRANVVSTAPLTECLSNDESIELGNQGWVLETSHSPVEEDSENNNANSSIEVLPENSSIRTTNASLSTFRDLRNLEEMHCSIIEVKDVIRRSISMDFIQRDHAFLQGSLSRTTGGSNDADEEEDKEKGYVDDQRASCSKIKGKDVKGLFTIKRSVSSGRFFLTRSLGAGRGKTTVEEVIPP